MAASPQAAAAAALITAAAAAVRSVPAAGQRAAVVGTRIHTAFKNAVDALNLPGVRTEVSYVLGNIEKWGKPGSIRLDAVQYGGDGRQIIQIFDLKTGNAGHDVSADRANLPQLARGSETSHHNHPTMNQKQLSALAKRLLPSFPTLSANGTLLFIRPIGHVLRGIDLDRSGDTRAFYVWAFFQPLCVPATSIYFNLGWRLGGESHRWHADDPSVVDDLKKALTEEALPFLDVIRTPRDAAVAGEALRQSMDGATQRAIAYSFARAGDVSQAIRALDRYLDLGKDDNRDWVRARSEEASALRATLLSNPSEAQRRLAGWEDKTAEALGLSAFR